MVKLVHITVTDDEALDMRLALNAYASFWAEQARAARVLGNLQAAASCRSIQEGYNCLWSKVEAAQREASTIVRDAAEGAELAGLLEAAR